MPEKIEKEVENFKFPEQFLFGVATSGYQVEGGYNTETGPKNNWYEWEKSGKVEKTGEASRFWELYPEDFARCKWMGNNSFRLGIDWGRLQPAESFTGSPPPISEEAVEGYAKILNEAYKNSLEPLVTLFHWTYPHWVGKNLWLNEDKIKNLFVPALTEAVEKINSVLIEKYNRPPIKYLITINEPIFASAGAYLLKKMPGHEGSASLEKFKASLMNIFWAHVLLYRSLHKLYRERNWPTPEISSNSWCGSIYEIDKMFFDVCMAKANGVSSSEIEKFLTDERRAMYAIISQSPRRSLVGLRRTLENLLASVIAKRLFTHWPVQKFIEEVYRGDELRLVDYLPFDFYDPFLCDYIRFTPLIKPAVTAWEWWSVPEALTYFLKSYSRTSKGLPIRIVENGIAFEAPYNATSAKPRPDDIVRHWVIQSHVLEIIRAINQGINVDAYYHWSLVDNYEWGSFTPRFGIFGVIYPEGARRLKKDMYGDNAGGAYKLICEAFKNKDKNALLAALSAEKFPEIEF